jgi:hypothetical protein
MSAGEGVVPYRSARGRRQCPLLVSRLEKNKTPAVWPASPLPGTVPGSTCGILPSMPPGRLPSRCQREISTASSGVAHLPAQLAARTSLAVAHIPGY